MTVQFEQLSDHAGDELRLTKERSSEARRNAQLWEEHVAYVDAHYRQVSRARPLWKRLFGMASSEMRDAEHDRADAHRQSDQARDHASRLEQEVDQQGAGVRGEQFLATWLVSSLSDEWVGFGGYRNKKGEADLVLVGPSGVWVIEVKNRNAQLFANGDQWQYRKLDNYGNVVDSGPAIDRKRRTWGQQASHVAESLSWWLGHNQLQVPVRTAVVLVHPKASVGSSESPGVDVLTADARDLVAAASEHHIVGRDVRVQVATLIRRDHSYHDRKLR
jgi:Nuclease-related domain